MTIPQHVVNAATRAFAGLTGAVALGAAAKALHDQQYAVRLMYTHSGAAGISAAASAMFGRMYAAWLLVSGAVRVLTAVRFSSTAGRVALAWTYAVALLHYVLEVFVYGTVPLRPGGQVPLAVASCALLLMGAEQYVCGDVRRQRQRQAQRQPQSAGQVRAGASKQL